MTIPALLEALRRNLFGGALGPLGRGAWCRKQRRRLAAPGHSVVWVRADTVPWAEWGARHGYFEVQHMDGLPYLRTFGAPAA